MRRRAIAAIAALTAMLLLITALRAHAHPLHTTLTDVVVQPTSVRATVRLFADDLAAAIGAHARADDEIVSYVARTLTLLDGARTLSPHGCGVRRAADLVWICIEASVAGAPQSLSVRDALLHETFADQINIVQCAGGSKKRSLVFVRGDGVKRLF